MKIFIYILLFIFSYNLSLANDKNQDFKYKDSIFFTEKKINIIERVYKIYEKNAKNKDKEIITGVQIENNENETQSLTATLDIITLNSLLFLNPSDWVVWINGKKITLPLYLAMYVD